MQSLFFIDMYAIIVQVEEDYYVSLIIQTNTAVEL